MRNSLGVQLGESVWIVLSIPVVVGSICGVLAVRFKSSGRPWSIPGIVLAPIPAVLVVYTYTVGVDFMYGAHSNSTYAAMLIQSMARGCLIVPAMLIICTPLAAIGSGISQLLCAGLASLRHGASD
jgi:hypothetical protein